MQNTMMTNSRGHGFNAGQHGGGAKVPPVKFYPANIPCHLHKDLCAPLNIDLINPLPDLHPYLY
jgi:hypothetical protein